MACRSSTPPRRWARSSTNTGSGSWKSRRATAGAASRVFGSVARGEANERSDIHFLVDFESDSSLFDLLHLTEELEELLGHPGDVVSTGGFKDRDGQILAEAVDL